jgi:hypothetical protein
MSGRIREHLRSNVVGYIALFFALSTGSAVALSGSNTVFTDDVVDNQVYSADVRNDTLSGGGLAAADLKPGSVGTSEVAADSLGAGDLAPSSVGSSEVVNNSLTGADVDESSLALTQGAIAEDSSDTDVSLSGGTCVQVRSVVISNPKSSPQDVLVIGSANLEASHTQATRDLISVNIDTASASCGIGVVGAAAFDVPAANPSVSDVLGTLTTARRFSVPASGSTTFYLNAIAQSGASTGDEVDSANVAVMVP